MRPQPLLRTAVLTIVLLIGILGTEIKAQSAQVQPAAADSSRAIIALMPFLQGQLESPNAPLPKPLSQSLAQMAVDYRGLPEGTDEVMNRLVNHALTQRFPDRLVPWAQVTAAYEAVSQEPLLETPRKRAVQLGEALQADIVVVGTVWRFREKGAVDGMPDSPASVGFALYLVEVATGARLERGFFDGTQKALTEDVLGGAKQLGMGLRWLSAEELARYGIKTVLRKLSPRMDR